MFIIFQNMQETWENVNSIRIVLLKGFCARTPCGYYENNLPSPSEFTGNKIILWILQEYFLLVLSDQLLAIIVYVQHMAHMVEAMFRSLERHHASKKSLEIGSGHIKQNVTKK